MQYLQFLHAVQLSDSAYACGKVLKQLALDELAVAVKSVRRGNEEYTEVHGNFELAQDDVVVLAGGPRAIEASESYLLNG